MHGFRAAVQSYSYTALCHTGSVIFLGGDFEADSGVNMVLKGKIKSHGHI